MADINDYPGIPPVPVIPLPLWATQEYENATEDMIQDIHAAVFWREVSKLKIVRGKQEMTMPADKTVLEWYQMVLDAYPDEASQMEINARLISDGFVAALQASDNSVGLFERARMFFLYQLKINNRWASSGEAASFEEFLIDKLPRLSQNSGERNDILFVIEQMIPILKQIGSDWVEMLFTLQDKYSKLRGAVPALRNAVRDFDMSIKAHENAIEEKNKKIGKLSDKAVHEHNPEKAAEYQHQIETLETEIEVVKKDQELIREVAADKFSETVGDILSAVVNPEIPVNGPNGIASYLRRGRETVHINAHMSIFDKNTVFVLTVPAEYSTAVENGLKFVDFSNVDPTRLPSILEKALKKNMGKRKDE